jgi:ribA/ribD-fused uncharacterized protein
MPPSAKLQWFQSQGLQKHNESEICGFFEDYRWLSNFHICTVSYEGLSYPSSENAYQAAKYPPEERPQFTVCTPSVSKKLGRLAAINPAASKEEVMLDCLRDKFTNPDLRQKLLDTGERHLEETNWWGDTFWGVCDGVGKNMLGKLLMLVRDELRP